MDIATEGGITEIIMEIILDRAIAVILTITSSFTGISHCRTRIFLEIMDIEVDADSLFVYCARLTVMNKTNFGSTPNSFWVKPPAVLFITVSSSKGGFFHAPLWKDSERRAEDRSSPGECP